MDLRITIRDEDDLILDEVTIYQDGSDSDGAARVRAVIQDEFVVEFPEIKRFIHDGNLHEPETKDDILEQAGRLLDKACSEEIVGPVTFETVDGRIHVGTVEFVIGEATESYKETLRDDGLLEEDPQAQQERYIHKGGAKCPYCGSPHLQGGFVEIEAGRAYQDVACLQCNKAWIDSYKLFGFTPKGED